MGKGWISRTLNVECTVYWHRAFLQGGIKGMFCNKKLHCISVSKIILDFHEKTIISMGYLMDLIYRTS